MSRFGNKNRIAFYSPTIGTGAYTFGTALVGHRTPSFLADGTRLTCRVDYGADWEVGEYVKSGSTLVRTTIYESTNGDGEVDWPNTDNKMISCGILAQNVLKSSDGSLIFSDDPADGTTDISAGTLQTEFIEDTVAALLIEGSGISLDYDDVANELEVACNFYNTGVITVTNILLPTTTSSVGQIKWNNVTHMHTYGTSSIFVGALAGNFTNTATGNVGIGPSALLAVTTGSNNAAFGQALFGLTTGGYNVGIGGNALYQVTTGSDNVAVGVSAGAGITTGSNNTFIGFAADAASNLTNVTAIGANTHITASNTLMLGDSATGVIVGGTAAIACAAFAVTSTTRGLLLPRLTTTERDAVGSPVDGLLIYNTTTDVLNAYQNGAWAAVGGSGGEPSDGDKGDITVSASGVTWTIDDDVVTYAKMQNVSATDKLLGRSTAGAGNIEEITCTAAGRALLDDAAASDQRTTLGLGSAATGAFGDATFNEATDDRVAALLIAGTNITLTYADGPNTLTISASGGGGGDALTTNPLSQFAATTSAQLRGVISDETGSDALVFATSPALTTPTIAGSTLSGTHQITGRTYSNLDALTDGSTITIDWSTGNTFTVTLGGNRTIAFSNDVDGQLIKVRFEQDGTGSRTLTWPSGIKWAGGSAPTLTLTASKADWIGFIRTGSGAYDGFVLSKNH